MNSGTKKGNGPTKKTTANKNTSTKNKTSAKKTTASKNSQAKKTTTSKNTTKSASKKLGASPAPNYAYKNTGNKKINNGPSQKSKASKTKTQLTSPKPKASNKKPNDYSKLSSAMKSTKGNKPLSQKQKNSLSKATKNQKSGPGNLGEKGKAGYKVSPQQQKTVNAFNKLNKSGSKPLDKKTAASLSNALKNQKPGPGNLGEKGKAGYKVSPQQQKTINAFNKLNKSGSKPLDKKTAASLSNALKNQKPGPGNLGEKGTQYAKVPKSPVFKNTAAKKAPSTQSTFQTTRATPLSKAQQNTVNAFNKLMNSGAKPLDAKTAASLSNALKNQKPGPGNLGEHGKAGYKITPAQQKTINAFNKLNKSGSKPLDAKTAASLVKATQNPQLKSRTSLLMANEEVDLSKSERNLLKERLTEAQLDQFDTLNSATQLQLLQTLKSTKQEYESVIKYQDDPTVANLHGNDRYLFLSTDDKTQKTLLNQMEDGATGPFKELYKNAKFTPEQQALINGQLSPAEQQRFYFQMSDTEREAKLAQVEYQKAQRDFAINEKNTLVRLGEDATFISWIPRDQLGAFYQASAADQREFIDDIKDDVKDMWKDDDLQDDIVDRMKEMGMYEAYKDMDKASKLRLQGELVRSQTNYENYKASKDFSNNEKAMQQAIAEQHGMTVGEFNFNVDAETQEDLIDDGMDYIRSHKNDLIKDIPDGDPLKQQMIKYFENDDLSKTDKEAALVQLYRRQTYNENVKDDKRLSPTDKRLKEILAGGPDKVKEYNFFVSDDQQKDNLKGFKKDLLENKDYLINDIPEAAVRNQARDAIYGTQNKDKQLALLGELSARQVFNNNLRSDFENINNTDRQRDKELLASSLGMVDSKGKPNVGALNYFIGKDDQDNAIKTINADLLAYQNDIVNDIPTQERLSKQAKNYLANAKTDTEKIRLLRELNNRQVYNDNFRNDLANKNTPGYLRDKELLAQNMGIVNSDGKPNIAALNYNVSKDQQSAIIKSVNQYLLKNQDKLVSDISPQEGLGSIKGGVRSQAAAGLQQAKTDNEKLLLLKELNLRSIYNANYKNDLANQNKLGYARDKELLATTLGFVNADGKPNIGALNYNVGTAQQANIIKDYHNSLLWNQHNLVNDLPAQEGVRPEAAAYLRQAKTDEQKLLLLRELDLRKTYNRNFENDLANQNKLGYARDKELLARTIGFVNADGTANIGALNYNVGTADQKLLINTYHQDLLKREQELVNSLSPNEIVGNKPLYKNAQAYLNGAKTNDEKLLLLRELDLRQVYNENYKNDLANQTKPGYLRDKELLAQAQGFVNSDGRPNLGSLNYNMPLAAQQEMLSTYRKSLLSNETALLNDIAPSDPLYKKAETYLKNAKTDDEKLLLLRELDLRQVYNENYKNDLAHANDPNYGEMKKALAMNAGFGENVAGYNYFRSKTQQEADRAQYAEYLLKTNYKNLINMPDPVARQHAAEFLSRPGVSEADKLTYLIQLDKRQLYNANFVAYKNRDPLDKALLEDLASLNNTNIDAIHYTMTQQQQNAAIAGIKQAWLSDKNTLLSQITDPGLFKYAHEFLGKPHSADDEVAFLRMLSKSLVTPTVKTPASTGNPALDATASTLAFVFGDPLGGEELIRDGLTRYFSGKGDILGDVNYFFNQPTDKRAEIAAHLTVVPVLMGLDFVLGSHGAIKVGMATGQIYRAGSKMAQAEGRQVYEEIKAGLDLARQKGTKLPAAQYDQMLQHLAITEGAPAAASAYKKLFIKDVVKSGFKTDMFRSVIPAMAGGAGGSAFVDLTHGKEVNYATMAKQVAISGVYALFSKSWSDRYTSQKEVLPTMKKIFGQLKTAGRIKTIPSDDNFKKSMPFTWLGSGRTDVTGRSQDVGSHMAWGMGSTAIGSKAVDGGLGSTMVTGPIAGFYVSAYRQLGLGKKIGGGVLQRMGATPLVNNRVVEYIANTRLGRDLYGLEKGEGIEYSFSGIPKRATPANTRDFHDFMHGSEKRLGPGEAVGYEKQMEPAVAMGVLIFGLKPAVAWTYDGIKLVAGEDPKSKPFTQPEDPTLKDANRANGKTPTTGPVYSLNQAPVIRYDDTRGVTSTGSRLNALNQPLSTPAQTLADFKINK